MARARDIYGGKDRRQIPIYSVPEAAEYLAMPATTLRQWVSGRLYQTKDGSKKSPAVIPARSGVLSFLDLVEAHILGALTREHGIRLKEIRTAINYVERELEKKRPLLTQEFVTDGVSLFIERFNRLINASRGGQVAMPEILEASLRRIERDESGWPVRLYPWTKRSRPVDEPRLIVIDPGHSFGRPTIASTGVRAEVVADRFAAGDDLEDIAEDYRLEVGQVEAALRWQLNVAQAA